MPGNLSQKYQYSWEREALKRAQFEASFTQPPNPYRPTTTTPTYQRPTTTPTYQRPTTGSLASSMATGLLLDIAFTAAGPLGEALGDAYFNQNYQALNPYNPQSPIGRDAILDNLQERLESFDPLSAPFDIINLPFDLLDLADDLLDPFLPPDDDLDQLDPPAEDPLEQPESPFELDPNSDPAPYFLPPSDFPDSPDFPEAPSWNPPGSPGGPSLPPLGPSHVGTFVITIREFAYPDFWRDYGQNFPQVEKLYEITRRKELGEEFSPQTIWLEDPEIVYGEGSLSRSHPNYADALDYLFWLYAHPAWELWPKSWWFIELQTPLIGIRLIPAIRQIVGIVWIPDPIGGGAFLDIDWPWPELDPPETPLLDPPETPELDPPEEPVLNPPEEPVLDPPEEPVLNPPPQLPPEEPQLDPPDLTNPPPPTPVCRYQTPWHRFDTVDAKTNETNNNVLASLAEFLVVTGNQKTMLDRLGPQLEGGLSQWIEKINGMTRKTWDFLQIDRVLLYLNYWTNIHNAYMLSYDIAETLFSSINNVLYLIGIEDADGNPLNVGQIVGDFLEGMAQALFGVERLEGIKQQWAHLNRIYQTGINIIYSIQSIIDSLRSMVEIIGEYVAKIGNALKRSGQIMDNSFGWMQEKFNKFSIGQERWEKMFRRLENIEDVAGSMEIITGEAVSIATEIEELKNSRQELADAIAEYGELNSLGRSDEGITPESVNIRQAELEDFQESQAPETLTDPLIGFPEEAE